MKFDEAIEELENSYFEGVSPKLITLSDALMVINQLRQEYAPTIEMTKAQYETLMYYKHNEENHANPLAQLLLSLYEDVGGGDDWGLYDGWDVDEESELVLYVEAWLHPETIKVVDE